MTHRMDYLAALQPVFRLARALTCRIALMLPLLLFPAGALLATEKVMLQLCGDHQFEFAGYYAALWQGYYRNAGFDVEIRSAYTPEGRMRRPSKEVSEGRADFGVSTASILLAKDKGAPLVVLATIFQQSAVEFYSRTDTPLNSPADLTRLRVMRRVNEASELELRVMLHAEGISPSLVEPYPPPSDQRELAYLAEGKLDVIPGYSTDVPVRAQMLGIAVKPLRPASVGVDFYGDSLFTSEARARSDPERVERFVQASLKGWRYAFEQPQDIIDGIVRSFKPVSPIEDFPAYLKLQVKAVRDLTFYPVVDLGHINPERWLHMYYHLKEAGLVSGELDLEQFVFDPEHSRRERFNLLLKLVSAVLLVSLGVGISFFVWNRALRREIKERKRIEEELQRFATVDDLTEAYNRRYFFECAEREFERALRYKRPLSVMMIDLDRLKYINDTSGHLVGDQVLHAVAECLRQNLRHVDILGRYGGDEFIVFMPDSDRRAALETAERLREAVSRMSVPVCDANGLPIKISISVGVATLDETIGDFRTLLQDADTALYMEKKNRESGTKNRVRN